MTVTETPVLSDARKVFEAMRNSADNFNFDIIIVLLFRKSISFLIEKLLNDKLMKNSTILKKKSLHQLSFEI